MENREILTKPSLSLGDIMALEECSTRKARDIMKMCRVAFQGKIPMNCHKVTTESYLRFSGYPEGTWVKIIAGGSREDAEN